MGNVPCGRTTDSHGGWKQQNKQQAANVVYKYVNLQKGGKLVDAFNEEGSSGPDLEAVRRIIRDEMETFMYNHGKGKLLSKVDFIKWKKQCNAALTQSCVVDTNSEEELLAGFVEDRFAKFEEHEACWDINCRGGVGETPLHLCILNDTSVTSEIAKILLSLYPKLSLDIYEGPEYYGESALHIAIVYGEFEMVKQLVESGANINQRATGTFFLPNDQKKAGDSATNYEGDNYYGEYPLAFAACFGHEVIYDYLIDHGADPNLHDSFGNTVLHMLVINNQIGMFGYVVKHHVKKANIELENNAKLTPLTMASKLGRIDIFKEIIELQSIEFWRYSNITCSTYPLSPIDTIGKNGKINPSSALTYLTDGGEDDHLEMLGSGVIRQLLDEKWKTFARRRFIERLILALLHLLMLSVAIYTRPEREETNTPSTTNTTNIVRYISEIIVCCDCVTNLVFQIEEVRSQGIRSFFKNQKSAPAKFLFHLSCILILLCVPLRLLNLRATEDIMLSIAAPLAWMFLLFFARGAVLLGPFIIMIYQMCRSDLVRFVIIFVVFLLQFSQGFYFLFKDIDNPNIQSFKTLGGTMMQLFQMTLGEFKYNDFNYTRLPFLTKAVFAIFVIMVPILLLNMLIAMMGNTYQQISSRSEKEWRRQWAKIIVVLERSFSRKQLLRFQEEYSVPLVVNSKETSRGFMVIKTSRKTKARQRKGAISNWKRVVFEIKELIKDSKDDPGVALHMTSDKASAYQQRRRQSTVPSADNSQLLSAMTQLAWEKDIDLATGCSSLRHQPIPEQQEGKPEGTKEVSFVNLAYVGESSTDPPTEEVPQTEHLVVEDMEDVPQTEHLVVENMEDAPQVEGLKVEAMKTATTGVAASAEISKQRPASDSVAGRRPSGQSSRVEGEQQKKKRRRKRRSSKKNVMADSTKDGTDPDHSDTSGQAAELTHLSPPSSSSSLTCLLRTPQDT